MRPLLPFPFPISIGTDICQIHRIYRIVSGPSAARFVDRILTKDEQAWNGPRLRALLQQQQQQQQQQRQQQHDVPKRNGVRSDAEAGHEGFETIRKRNPEVWAAAAFLAGRFAAKEAAIKAHSHRRLTFHDVVIEPRADPGGGGGGVASRLGSGPKIARIRGEKGTAGDGEGPGESESKSDSSAMLSISHDGDYATASCLAYDPRVGELKEKEDKS